MNINSSKITEGVNLRLLKTEKFKTNCISLYIHLPLVRENVTFAALLPRVLKRGTERYPSLSELSKRTEELYGAYVSAGIVKKGDTQSIKFTLQFVSDTFLSEKITADAVELLGQLVLFPKLQSGAFDKDWVNQEKENLKNFIEGLINDKKQYAQVKCNEIMFEGDPYGIFEYGYVEDLENIDEKNLYEFYQNILRNSVIDIFASGSFDDELLENEIKSIFGELPPRNAIYTKTALAAVEDNICVKNVVEPMPTSQSKLCIGFNCGIFPVSEDYYNMMMFSCIFGGSPFSKLFNNVREKLSLAYYVFSAADRQKGYVKISAGIEADKFEAAYDEIMLQLEKMKTGDFSDDEIISAKKYLATSLGSAKDSLGAIENFYMGQIMLGNDETIDELIERVSKVQRDGIIKAAKCVQEDTIYFLKGVGNGEV
ncbi:MAG: insulinase family protein [Clostridia bacterium]|nr:insulinase family protein [Clostridia bacterium]